MNPLVEKHFFQQWVILVILSMGSCMHLLMPSKIQPRISFFVSHMPSPCLSFFSALVHCLGSLLGPVVERLYECHVTLNLWIGSVGSWKLIAQDWWGHACTLPSNTELLAAKTHQTSSSLFGIHNASSRCCRRSFPVSMYSWIISCAVSEAMQNSGGDSDHPIWRQIGFTIKFGCCLHWLMEVHSKSAMHLVQTL